ncbi:hypothetical protein [Bosea sp. BK604]|uniref:hypothetical protein n=1 Tax=Bosea sp. BK604 TaxID=2512180 RepID=UPI0010F049AC|nr:hypothetical protein [Bosea sp. BK604]TCR64649.1 hypothetical protein EV560_106114 [Bosea sp. BK604]
MPERRRPEPTSLYPDEKELARVILGDRASEWPRIAKMEERNGLPPISAVYGGRYWPAIRAFFDRRYKLEAVTSLEQEEEPNDGLAEWKAERARIAAAKAKKRPD